MSAHRETGFFERLKKGLEESIAYSKGKLNLLTTELPAPATKPEGGPYHPCSRTGLPKGSPAGRR
jgi:hypothetical protein